MEPSALTERGQGRKSRVTCTQLSAYEA
uniref:Uncharacterized protein n=1 Tax=Anguilla anguilla TaxID=7936 RepID=A0A0E9U110_ANGAN